MRTRPVARDPEPSWPGTMPLLAPDRKDSARIRTADSAHAPTRPYQPQNAFYCGRIVAATAVSGPTPHAIVRQFALYYIAS